MIATISSLCVLSPLVAGSQASSNWVGEVFTGLENQYEEFNNYFPDIAAAEKFGDLESYPYVDVSGERVINLFKKYQNESNGRLFRFKHTGVIDHVWAVEQLPAFQGYRVYQSYNGAYSLAAWLSTDSNLERLFGTEEEGADIVVWGRVVTKVDEAIQQMCPGLSIQDAEKVSSKTCPMLGDYEEYIPKLVEFGIYVRDYDSTEVIKNFRMSWEKYGKGKIIELDAFVNGYLTQLAKITGFFDKVGNNNCQGVWTKELSDIWTTLFASPSPMTPIGLPFTMLPGLMGLSGYHLEVLVEELDATREENCCRNAKRLVKSFPDSMTPFIESFQC